MPSPSPVLVWFRDDLRLADNPALTAAIDSGRPLLCVYVFDEDTPGLRALGGAARWWLHGSLTALFDSLLAIGGRLDILRGPAGEIVADIVESCGIETVVWNRRYGAAEIALDKKIKAALGDRGVTVRSFDANLLHAPWALRTKAGDPFRVFTPFARALRESGEPRAPLPAPSAFPGAAWPSGAGPRPTTIDSLALEPRKPDWAGGLRAAWTCGEAAARQRLADFLDGALAGYAQGRDHPDRVSTSRLSPHLRFGEISPFQVWHAAHASLLGGESAASRADLDKFISELAWREFSYHLLFHNPDLVRRNHQGRFDSFPWRDDAPGFAAWSRGMTGYPIVDAGMRELWATGWMHNRVRMIAASFLTKDLLIDWRAGEAWFWDTLVDADAANNAASWQWVAGSGADAAPFFRIFNPVLQGEKFDPRGTYVRRWVPELAGLPDQLIHKPWLASPADLARACLRLGRDYPLPMVDHGLARQRALDALATLQPPA